jgi:ABC-2 type transport system ATP-binding protein
VRERDKSSFLASVKSFFDPNTRKIYAVDDISFSLKEGELRGLIGPNGAGKSTIIKMLSGVLFPSSGKADVFGYVPWRDRKAYVRKIGVLFGQKSQLIWELPAIDTFDLNRVIYKINKHSFKTRLDYFIELLQLADIIKKPVRQLSLGERMKCELVCSVLHNPKLVFLDEPTIGMDVISKEAIRGFIKQVNKDHKITFIITTHDLSDIQDLCKKITIINKGKKVFDDSIDQLTSLFINRKVLNLDFSCEISRDKLSSYDLLEYKSMKCQIEIDVRNKSIKDYIYELFSNFPIQDITISSIPIEEIIKTIYKN